MTRVVRKILGVLLSGAVFVAPAFAQQEECPEQDRVVIDFDTNSFGADLPAGTIVSNQWSGDFVNITVASETNTGILFDSANPTGNDPDLGAPNETCVGGGPGVGAGGEVGQLGENCNPLGKVLIIAEDIGDTSPADGLVDEPNDDPDGGVVTFDFDFGVKVLSVDLLDIEEEGKNEAVFLDGFDAGAGSTFSVEAAKLGDNSFQTVGVNQGDFTTTRMEVNFDDASGAIARVEYCLPPPGCEDKVLTQTYLEMDGNSFEADKINRRLTKIYKNLTGKKLQSVRAQSNQLYLDNWTVTWAMPETVQVDCQVPQLCVTVNNTLNVMTYDLNALELREISRDVYKKIKKKTETGDKKRKKARKLNKRAGVVLEESVALSSTVPLMPSSCSE